MPEEELKSLTGLINLLPFHPAHNINTILLSEQ